MENFDIFSNNLAVLGYLSSMRFFYNLFGLYFLFTSIIDSTNTLSIDFTANKTFL